MNKKIMFFITVVEEGNFSKAAKKLYVSQSAISQQISQLERELGVILFNRDGYLPRLTKAGSTYYNGCKQFVKEYLALEEKVKYLEKESQLKIGVTGPFENKHLPYIIKLFKEKYPRINIVFIQGNFHRCIELLIHKELDIYFGIESDVKNKEELEYECLFKHQICVIASYEHPLSNVSTIDIHRISKEPVISLSKTFGTAFYNDFNKAFKKDGFFPNVIKEVDTLDELILAVKLNEGIAFTSKEVVREEDVAIIDLVNSHHQSNYVVSWNKEQQSDLISYLIKTTKEYFSKTL